MNAEAASAAGQPALPAASAAMLASVIPPAASAASAAGARTAGKKLTMDELRKTGSLRGTELDGNWGVYAGDTLQPSDRLRQRFDHLLVGIGEVDEADMRAWIKQQVTAAHGDKAAEQVLAVWDAYLKLQRSQVGGKAADPTDAAAWQRWIAERSATRSAAMGSAWSQAFFAQEEQNLRDYGERMVQRAAAPPGALEPEHAAQRALLPSGTVLEAKAVAERHAQRVQHFGAEGAQRLAEEDKAWAEWNQRIDSARTRQQQIRADKQLSEPQRRQAIEADLATRFQGTELIRAKGLLGG